MWFLWVGAPRQGARQSQFTVFSCLVAFEAGRSGGINHLPWSLGARWGWAFSWEGILKADDALQKHVELRQAQMGPRAPPPTPAPGGLGRICSHHFVADVLLLPRLLCTIGKHFPCQVAKE